MSDEYPIVEVAVVLITDAEGRFLVDYNDRWAGFTLPMSKRRELPPKIPTGKPTTESAKAAALRAAAEVLGRPLSPTALVALKIDVPPYNQSGREMLLTPRDRHPERRYPPC